MTKQGRSENYSGTEGFARTSMVDKNGANEVIGRNRSIAGVVYQVSFSGIEHRLGYVASTPSGEAGYNI